MPSTSTSTARTGAQEGDYHCTTSEIDATEVSGSHVLTIKGYSQAKGLPRNEFISSSFTFAGHSWSIRYYPNGCGTYKEVADYASVYLVAGAPDVMARFSISLVSNSGRPYCSDYMCQFLRMSEPRGFQAFVNRNALELSDCLRNDSFKIRCEITMLKLVRNLGDLLSSGDGADVMFEVGWKTFKAQRSILTARSPVFKAELFSPMKEGTATCAWIDDMEGGVFKALLHFIYTDTFPDVDEGDAMAMAQHLLVAADRYGLERLKLMCEEKLCRYIGVSSVSTLLALAEQHGCAGLKKACFGFLMSGNNLLAASIVTGSFERLTNSCPSILPELLSKLTVTSSS
ncbi:unnamed protein product [Urochloa decumbens]|uniref:Uncharacterized protein n=1 Tax=Urochloa decumbens TaxID=240449 RepID=A0ABC9ALZ5_9POAL